MALPHPSGDYEGCILYMVFPHVSQKSASSPVLIVVVVIFMRGAVFCNESIHQNTVIRTGSIRIYQELAVQVVDFSYRVDSGTDCQEF